MPDVPQHVATLLHLLAEANEKIPGVTTAACLFVDPTGGPHCANLTESQCAALGGKWDPNTKCLFGDPTRPGECKAQ